MSTKASRSHVLRPIFALLILGGAGLYYWQLAPQWRPRPLLGVVRQTEIRVAAEKNGRLSDVVVRAGQIVKKGDLLAVLDSPELTASVTQAQASAQQVRADRDNVFAGVRKEQVDISARNVEVAESNVTLAKQQYDRISTLSAKNFASRQQLDEATSTLNSNNSALTLARAAYAQNQAGPTTEERAIAEARVIAANASTATLQASLAKMQIRSQVDGTVGLIVATPGEIISPGQTILTVEPIRQQWFSFTIREDLLNGLTIGSSTTIQTTGNQSLEGRVTEMRPLGEFAVWRAARAVGDHDLNSFLVRIDPTKPADDIRPGMTVEIPRQAP